MVRKVRTLDGIVWVEWVLVIRSGSCVVGLMCTLSLFCRYLSSRATFLQSRTITNDVLSK